MGSMDGSTLAERRVEGVSCGRCQLRFDVVGGAVAVSCPLCHGALKPTGTTAATVSTRSVSFDVRVFERAVYGVAARARASDRWISSLEMPAALRPVHVPMRRIRGWYESRGPEGTLADADRRYEADVCLAVGLPEPLLQALEARIVIGPLPESAPAGELCLVRCDPETAMERAARQLRRVRSQEARGDVTGLVRAEPQPGVEYFRTIWWCRVEGPGRSLELAVDALAGDVLYEAWAHVGSPRWAAFSDPIALALTVAFVGLIGGMAVATDGVPFEWSRPVAIVALILAAGWIATRDNADRRMVRAGAERGDLIGIEVARRQLAQRRHRFAAALLLLGMLSMVSAGAGWLRRWASGDPLAGLTVTERGIDAETLRPWNSIHPNFLQSPFGVNGRDYVITSAVPRIGPVLRGGPVRPTPWTGLTLTVGPGGYPTLVDAINRARAGDRVVVEPGVHPGGRAVVRRDLEIEGKDGAVIEWVGGRGPFIEIGGADTTLVIRHLRWVAHQTNSNLIGDPNVAYGGEPAGVRPHVILDDLMSGGAGVNEVSLRSPGATIEIRGGILGSITATNLDRLTIRPRLRVPEPASGTIFHGTPIGGLAQSTCVICVGYTDEVQLEGVTILDGTGDVSLMGGIGHVYVGPHVGNLRVRLLDDTVRDVGILPLPTGYPFEFRVSHGVAEF
jgi:hypothetical protein